MARKSIMCLLLVFNFVLLNSQASTGEKFTQEFIYKLIENDTKWFGSYLKRYPNYFSQRIGRDVRGKKTVIGNFDLDHRWLIHSKIDSSSIVLGDFIYTRERMIQQLEVSLDTANLRMAIVTDVWDDKIDFVRLYYNHMAIDTIEVTQNPIFSYNASLKTVLPNALKSFLYCMEKSNLEDLAYVLSDSISYTTYEGYQFEGDQLMELLDSSLVDGGFKIQPTRVTYEGKTCALEYNVLKWGADQYNSAAAMSVFQIDKDEIVSIKNFGSITTPVDMSHFIKTPEEEVIEVESELMVKSNNRKYQYTMLSIGCFGIFWLVFKLVGKSSL